jgi:uncharacterized protein YbjT (DUF2867 family)
LEAVIFVSAFQADGLRDAQVIADLKGTFASLSGTNLDTTLPCNDRDLPAIQAAQSARKVIIEAINARTSPVKLPSDSPLDPLGMDTAGKRFSPAVSDIARD